MGKETCIRQVAELKHDASLCDKISDTKIKESCIERSSRN